MSIIPYSQDGDNRVIASLPTSDSLVLYNKSTNSLEIVSNVRSGFERSASPRSGASRSARGRRTSSGTGSQDRADSLRCPNCGIMIDIAGAGLRPTSGSSTSPLGHSGTLAPEMRPDPASYIDTDYFKLLQAHFQASVSDSFVGQRFISNEENNDGPYITLSESLFTQGYFQKFFKILKKIGTGSNGSVYKVEHSLDNVRIGVFAMKKIGIGEDANNLVNILKEVQFLYGLTNGGELYNNSSVVPEEEERTSGMEFDDFTKDMLAAVDGARHLIKYNHVWLENDNASTFGPKIPCVFILFEYCDGGDLENYLAKRFHDSDPRSLKEKLLRRKKGLAALQNDSKFLNNFEILKIFKDICFGVYQLHKSHIIHRDLKPSNCLLKASPNPLFKLKSVHDLEKFPDVVVSDFGESAMEGTKRESSGYTGTLEFTSPELIFETVESSTGSLRNFGKKSDVYSMGLILFYLCFNKLPYSSGNDGLVKTRIERYYNDHDTQSFLFGNDGGSAESIRPISESGQDDDENALLRDFVDLIVMMCDANPDKRPSMDEIIVFLVKDIWQKLELPEVVQRRRSDSVETILLADQGTTVVETDQQLPREKLTVTLAISVVGVLILAMCVMHASYGTSLLHFMFFVLGLSVRYL